MSIRGRGEGEGEGGGSGRYNRQNYGRISFHSVDHIVPELPDFMALCVYVCVCMICISCRQQEVMEYKYLCSCGYKHGNGIKHQLHACSIFLEYKHTYWPVMYL